MQRQQNSIQISSFIVFFSILTILTQFILYYFIDFSYLLIGVSSITPFILVHVLIEKSHTYEISFIYTILTVFISIVITALSYLSAGNTFVPYSTNLLLIIAINWFVPTIYSFIREMFDYGTRIEDYNSYFRNQSIVFLVVYFVVLFYFALTNNNLAWYPYTTYDQINFNPFHILLSKIEGYRYHQIFLSEILTYLFSRSLPYLPYGFYCFILLREHSRSAKIISLFVLPIVIETVQYFIQIQRCDLGDIIYGFLGGLIGFLSFLLLNWIFRVFSGNDYLARESEYHFANRSLHF